MVILWVGFATHIPKPNLIIYAVKFEFKSLNYKLKHLKWYILSQSTDFTTGTRMYDHFNFIKNNNLYFNYQEIDN